MILPQLAVGAGSTVNITAFPISLGVTSVPGSGEVEAGGGNIGFPPLAAGDDILLGTIEFECLGPGTSELWIFDTDKHDGG